VTPATVIGRTTPSQYVFLSYKYTLHWRWRCNTVSHAKCMSLISSSRYKVSMVSTPLCLYTVVHTRQSIIMIQYDTIENA